jgi:glycosyltransferase involved in cell wall biosynthesis
VVDIIEPGRNALGVPPADASAMAGALRSLFEDASLRASLGAQARQTVCRRFNQDRIGSEVLDLYRQLAALSVATQTPRDSSPVLLAESS